MKALVLFNNLPAGILEKNESGYSFQYNQAYLINPEAKSISLTFPKSKKEFHSQYLFSFFHGLLTEGFATKIQTRKLNIDEQDYFSRLVRTANLDTIGCVTLEEINE